MGVCDMVWTGRRVGAYAVLFGCVVALSGACAEEPAMPPSLRSNVAVSLPDTPDLSVRVVKRFHAPGIYTVEGLLRDREKALGQKVTVRGRVGAVSLCPEEISPKERRAGEGDRGPRMCSPAPRATLVDGSGGTRWELLVVGSMWSSLGTLVQGDEITLEGRFDFVNPERTFLRQEGLLLLDDLDVTEEAVP